MNTENTMKKLPQHALYYAGLLALVACYTALGYYCFSVFPEWENAWHGYLGGGFFVCEALILYSLDYASRHQMQNLFLWVTFGSKVFRVLLVIATLVAYYLCHPETTGMFAIDMLCLYMLLLIYETIFFVHRSMNNND
jgi:hypothetical protein